MVQVGCTINYGRCSLWKETEFAKVLFRCSFLRPSRPSSACSAVKGSALTILPRSARIIKVVRKGRLVVSPNKWACGAAGSALPWHGRGRRFDPDQVHHFQLLTDTPLFSLVSFGVKAVQTLPFSVKSPGAIPTKPTIFSTTYRYPDLKFGLFWLQSAVTASVVWKRSLA